MSISRTLPSPTLAASPELAATDERAIAEHVNALWTELSDPVYRYVVSCLRHPADAEEITQEAFLRLFRALTRRHVLARTHTIRNPRRYVFRVARNLVLDHMQHARAQGPECELSAAIADRLYDPQPTAEDRLDRARERALFDAWLADLSPTQRECLYLRAEGLFYREIGKIMRMDPRRVVSAIARGLSAMQRRVDQLRRGRH